MSAARLREAAALMRSRANQAEPGPWTTGAHEMDLQSGGHNFVNGCCEGDGYLSPNNARHIASWHPAVTLAVADLLDAQAKFVEDTGMAGFDIEGLGDASALAVADAYLGAVR